MKFKVTGYHFIIKKIGGVLLLSIFLYTTVLGKSDLNLRNSSLQTDFTNSYSPLIITYDQPYYFEGEQVNFTVYVARNKQTTSTRQLIHVVLKLGEGSSETIKLLTQEGIAYGSYTIPEHTGNQNLFVAAYASGNEAVNKQMVYRKRLHVYDTKKPERITSIAGPAVTTTFYPEGGNLLFGITTKVVVHAVDSLGLGSQSKGYILNERGDTLSSYRTNNTGYGAFYLTPQQGEDYHALAETGTVTFPHTKESGIGIQLLERAQLYRIIFHKKIPDTISVVIHSRGKPSYETHINKELSFLDIAKEKLPNGLSEILIADKAGKVLAKRILFNNSYSLPLAFEQDQHVLRLRQLVTGNIIANPDFEEPFNLQLKVSHRFRSVKTSPQYSVLQQEIIGTPLTVEAFEEEDLDNFLISKEWSVYNFQNIFSDKVYPPIKNDNSLHIRGQLVNSSQEPLANTKLFFTLLNQKITYQATTDSLGRVSIPILNFKGSDHIVVNNDNLDECTFIPTNPDLFKFDFRSLQNVPADKDVQFFAQNQRILKGYDLLSKDTIRNINNPFTHDGLPYNSEVFLQDYVSFNSMEEVFREIVPGVFAGFNSGVLRVYSPDQEKNFSGTPLIVIDGKPTFDPQKALTLLPNEVTSVAVINEDKQLKSYLPAGRNGLIVINTKNHSSERKYSDKQIFTLQGIQEDKILDQILSTEENIPYLISLLHSERLGTLNPGEHRIFSFQTFDLTGQATIVAEIMTEEGAFMVQEFPIEVQVLEPK